MLPAWTHGQPPALAPAAVTCNIVAAACVGIGGGTSLFTAATCNGTGNDNTAFTSFNTWATGTWQPAHSGLIELDIPHGGNCVFSTAGNSNTFALGIKQLRVVGLGYSGNGDGATFSDNNGAGNFPYLAGGKFTGICGVGIADPASCSARLATVSAGASCVNLLDATKASLFIAPNYAMISAVDTAGSGYPPTPYFYEYPQISSVDAAHQCDGTTIGASVRFTSALQHTYKSTWPVYFPGNSGLADNGGPATLYALASGWDSSVQYFGMTFDSPGQNFGNAREILFNNVKATGVNCIIPSQNKNWVVTNADFSNCELEIDKINGVVTFNNVTVRRLKFQSASPDVFNLNNSTVTQFINGSPKKFVGLNSTINDFEPGATLYGFSTEVDCTSCTITTLGAFNASAQEVNHFNSMSGGVIMIPTPVIVSAQANNGSGLVRLTVPSTAAWTTGMKVNVSGPLNTNCSADIPSANYVVTIVDATHADLAGTTFSAGGVVAGCLMGPNFWPQALVPGENLDWQGQYQHEPPTMQITDMTQDGIATYAHTTLAGGFPSAPLSGTNLTLSVYNNLIQNYVNTTVGGVPYSPPAGSADGTYRKNTITSANSGLAINNVWGTATSITFNVTAVYAGASSINLNLGGPFVIASNGSTVTTWNPQINPKVSGPRVITLSGGVYSVTCNGSAGACSGDANLTPPDTAGISLVPGQITEQYSSLPGDIGATSVTVTIQTNTGAVAP